MSILPLNIKLVLTLQQPPVAWVLKCFVNNAHVQKEQLYSRYGGLFSCKELSLTEMTIFVVY